MNNPEFQISDWVLVLPEVAADADGPARPANTPAIVNGTAWSEDLGKWFYTVQIADGLTEQFEERDLIPTK